MSERMETPDWVTPGAEVIFVYARGYGTKARIEKVYKTGRFTLEGRDGQWRPDRGGASKATRDRYSTERIVPATDEHKAKAIRQHRLEKAKTSLFDEAERLQTIARAKDEDAILAAAEALATRPSSFTAGEPT